MPGWPIRKNEAGALPILVFPIYDADGDLVTGAANLDSERSIDQANFADCAAEAAEIAVASGIYSLAPTQAELNGDEIAFITKTSTGGAKTAVNVVYTSTRNIDDLTYPATTGRSLAVEADGMVEATVEEWIGVVPLALSAQRVQTHVGAFDANVITAAAIANAAIDAATFAAGAIDAAAIANGAIDAATFAAGAINAAAIAAAAITAVEAPNLDAAITSRSSHSAADAADAVLDEDMTPHQAQGTLGQAIGDPVADADTIFGMLTDIEDGNTTVEANVASMDANVITAAAIANAAIDAATFAAGAIDAAAIANAAIDAATFAAGAINAAAIAAAAITAVEAPNLDAAITSRSSHSAADAADAVLDEDMTPHQAQGTLGQTIGDSVADADTIYDMLTDIEDGNTTVEANIASIDANAITAAAIANGAIDAATFAAGAIDAAAIANAAIDAATFAANAIDAAALAADAALEIADAILQRDMDQVEAAAPVHSLVTAILKAVSRIRDNAGTLEIYRTNGVAIHMSQGITVDALLDPIDELAVGV